MASNKTLIIIMVLVSLSSILLHTHAAAAPTTTQDRVRRICSAATNATLCYQTVLPAVEREPKFTVYKVLEVEILETQKQVQTTMNVMSSLMAKPGMSKDVSDSLKVCQDQYDSMLDSIKKSLKLVAERDAAETRFKFSGVISYLTACNDEFTGDVASPIASEAKVVSDLGSNCLDLVTAIVDRESRRRGGKTVTAPSAGPPPPPNPCQHTVGFCSLAN